MASSDSQYQSTIPSLASSKQRHKRHNLCCQAAAKEVSTFEAANKRQHGFRRPGEAFGPVPRKVVWWALRKLSVEEWIVRLVQGMYANARSHW